MPVKFRRFFCLVISLLLAACLSGTASAEGMRTITSVLEDLNDADFLVTYDDSGVSRYGIFHPDETITPLDLDEDGLWRLLLPNEVHKPNYSFGVLPHGVYYEQVSIGTLEKGGFRIRRQDTGDVLYVSPENNGAEMVLNGWEDRIVILRRVSGFTDNTWTLCTVDQSGNLVGKEHDVGEYGPELARGLDSFGCGIFVRGLSWGPTCIFNMNADLFYSTAHTWSYASSVWPETGSAIWSGWNYGEITLEDLADPRAMDDLYQAMSQLDPPEDSPIKASIERESIGEGLYYGYKAFYYYSGRKAFDVPDYGSSTQIITARRFESGYAPLVYRGADGYYYVTMVDPTGMPQYSPIKLKNCGNSEYDAPGIEQDMETSMWLPTIFVGDGYIYYRDHDFCYMITPDGKETVLSKDYYYDCMGVHNGFLVFKEFLVSLNEPDRKITSGYVTGD